MSDCKSFNLIKDGQIVSFEYSFKVVKGSDLVNAFLVPEMPEGLSISGAYYLIDKNKGISKSIDITPSEVVLGSLEEGCYTIIVKYEVLDRLVVSCPISFNTELRYDNCGGDVQKFSAYYDCNSCADIVDCQVLTTLDELDFNESTNVLTVFYTGEDGVQQQASADLSALLDDTDTDTRIEFVQILPNGDWEFNIIDVTTGSVISSFIVPAGLHIEVLAGENITVDLVGNQYTVNGYGVVISTTDPQTLLITDPAGVVTTFTLPDDSNVYNTLSGGNLIATHVSGDGTDTDIFETVTTLIDNNDCTYTYTSENGTETIIDIISQVEALPLNCDLS